MLKCHGHFLNGQKELKSIKELDINNSNHVEWIVLSSNLRAANYKIPNENSFVIKVLINNIIPTTIITSSLISGLTILEFLINSPIIPSSLILLR